MPELPEVEALAGYLDQQLRGQVVARVDVVAFTALKTVSPAPAALAGLTVSGVHRRGKFLDVDVDGLHLVVHLSRAGWVAWRATVPPAPPRPGKGPLAVRVHVGDGSGVDVTEAGTQKRLAVYLVRDPSEVAGIARLGVDPLTEAFTPDLLAGLLQAAGRTQVKGLLRDQSVLAGVGNAYSDEILWAARLSPYAPAASLLSCAPALWEAIVATLRDAVARASGLAAGALKADKKLALAVHGRDGQPCPRCGDTVRSVSFADRSLQYCPTCQTAGRPLADRRLSRLLK